MLRKLRFVFTLTACVAAFGFVLSGCELEEESDATDSTGTPDVTGDNGTPDTTPDTVATLDYRYVRIDDVSGNSSDIDGGADIDAIILTKTSDGSTHFADSIEGYTHGGGNGDALDPQDALGAPDAFPDWPGSVDNCVVDSGFISLGGTNGQLIVGMPAAIEASDSLEVLEVGGCEFGGNNPAIEDDIQVYVSVAPESTSNWVLLGDGFGPSITFTIPALPEVPAQ